MLMQDRPSLCPNPVPPSVRMTVVMLEDGKAELQNPIQTPPASPRRWWNLSQHVMYAADEQVILIAKMCVERGPSHIRAIQDLFYDDGVIRLLGDQRNQCLSQQP